MFTRCLHAINFPSAPPKKTSHWCEAVVVAVIGSDLANFQDFQVCYGMFNYTNISLSISTYHAISYSIYLYIYICLSLFIYHHLWLSNQLAIQLLSFPSNLCSFGCYPPWPQLLAKPSLNVRTSQLQSIKAYQSCSNGQIPKSHWLTLWLCQNSHWKQPSRNSWYIH